jgi:hypothetical protein
MGCSSLSIQRRERRSGQWRGVIFALVLLGLLLSSGSLQSQDVSRRYQLKAVLLLNLLRFVEWPEQALGSTNAPVVIGILGYDPFGPLLEEVVRDEQVYERKIEIRRYTSVSEIDSCHLLFISSGEQRSMSSILTSLRNRPILTVSDAEQFVRHGGMIKFFTKPDGKTGLRINPGAARTAELRLRALLLQVAEIVNLEDD